MLTINTYIHHFDYDNSIPSDVKIRVFPSDSILTKLSSGISLPGEEVISLFLLKKLKLSFVLRRSHSFLLWWHSIIYFKNMSDNNLFWSASLFLTISLVEIFSAISFRISKGRFRSSIVLASINRNVIRIDTNQFKFCGLNISFTSKN
jgi:hypothetical protein